MARSTCNLAGFDGELRAGLAEPGDVIFYHTSFTFAWAYRQISPYSARPGAVVLDPWNGSGTTTAAAAMAGVAAIGADLLPVANLIAKLRHTSSAEVVQPYGEVGECRPRDPLLFWFTPQTAGALRWWADEANRVGGSEQVLVLNSLFKVVRALSKKFSILNGSIRKATPRRSPEHWTRAKIDSLMLATQEDLQWRLRPASGVPVRLLQASALKLPLADASVDLIVGAPPSFSLLDYPHIYARELAVLGVDVWYDRSLPLTMTGGLAVRGRQVESMPLGEAASSVMQVMATTAVPRGSSGICRMKYVWQYLDDLLNTFVELARVAKPGAPLLLVVRDTIRDTYRLSLGQVCAQEAPKYGWRLADTEVHRVERTHTAMRQYGSEPVFETRLELRRTTEPASRKSVE